jgi:ribose-phosphate pyrophosphokinase
MNFIFDFSKIKSNKSNKMSEKRIDELADWIFRLELDQEKMMIAVAKMKKKAVVISLSSAGSLGRDTVTSLSSYDKETYFTVATKYYHFGNNEINIFPLESVRKKDVFIIASGSNTADGSVNDNLMTLYSLIRSCRDASAKYITVVCTYMPYSRSDKKDQGRAPIMAKLVCDFFKQSGTSRLITVDLHAAQIQGYFDGPFDNLYAINYLIDAIKLDHKVQDMILISPDAGGEKRVAAYSKKMNIPYTFFTKTRDHSQISKIDKHEMVHQFDLVGKTCLIVDDIGDTLGTMNSCAQKLKDKGAKMVIAAITHGVFSGNAIDNLNNGAIDLMYVTDTVYQMDKPELPSKLTLVPLSDLIANSIKSCVEGKSMSALFD